MKVTLVLVFSIFLIVACETQKADFVEIPVAEVHVSGVMREVMQNGNLQANILLDTLENEGLIGLGPMGRLRGEITILDGKRYVTSLDFLGNPIPISADSLYAPFFAYSNVSSWQSFGFLKEINDLKSLQAAIEELASIEKLDLTKPFPFHIKGKITQGTYHIINKPADEMEHSHELHNQAKVSFNVPEKEVSLIGFYSQAHQGIFTHMGDFIHIHILFPENGITGHLDAIVANANSLELWVGLK